MTAKSRTLKVGLFVFVAIVLSTVAVFLIGENRRLWDRKVTYVARYDDVVGLKPGSVVRMGGIDVGSVTSVKHAEKLDDKKVYVEMVVAKTEAARVKRGTVAKIANKGLLGDKMIELNAYVPSPGQKPPADAKIPEGATEKELRAYLDGPVADGSMIWAEEAEDFGRIVGDAKDLTAQAKATLVNVEKLTQNLADPKLTEDVRGSVHALRLILEGVTEKEGAANRMIFDPEEGKRIDRILRNLEVTTNQLNATLADAHDITTRAKTGPGLVHALVYDDQLAQGTAGTMVELHNSLQAVRTGNGLAHAIVYGDDSTQHVMGNVSKMSDDLREIVANMKAGRGTIGALLVDPSVYEDVKSLVGNVERNQVLRALVRYSIKQDEARPHAEVKPAGGH